MKCWLHTATTIITHRNITNRHPQWVILQMKIYICNQVKLLSKTFKWEKLVHFSSTANVVLHNKFTSFKLTIYILLFLNNLDPLYTYHMALFNHHKIWLSIDYTGGFVVPLWLIPPLPWNIVKFAWWVLAMGLRCAIHPLPWHESYNRCCLAWPYCSLVCRIVIQRCLYTSKCLEAANPLLQMLILYPITMKVGLNL